MYHTYDPTPARKEKARAAAYTAIRLQPDLPEAHLALGFYYYYCERDYQNALKEFAIAKRSLPNSAEVYMAIGAIERRDRKSTRLNSSHLGISYAVFCLKKKKKKKRSKLSR